MQFVVESLEQLRCEGRFRSLSLNRELIDFSSNDYLGLSQHPQIKNALLEAIQKDIPLGATGSRLLSGNLDMHADVEEFLAKAFNSESALLFSSGYLANLATLSAFGTDQTEYFSDELNHASLIDGMRMTKAKRTIFGHNDSEDLRRLLMASQSPRKAIVTESVFSMDGDLAPLAELVDLAEEFEALLIVDEAHATGVFGETGLGRFENVRPSENFISIHTCGKALGSQGAFVLSSQKAREYLINFARPFIFSTAISPLLAVQIKTAVALLPSLGLERQFLHQLSQSVRTSVRDIFDIGKSESQIIPIILGSNDRVLNASRLLQENGFDVRAIRSPTVSPGTERLRISVKSSLRQDDVRALTKVLERVRPT
jgi:8-amino-7-oxononanoate synthase